MKILALDSSGLVATVAVLENDILLAEYTVNYKKTHSQTLLPMLEKVKEMIDLDMQSLDAIAVAKGPGSFTGLRIGAATAKGLALALKKPIVEIPTLEGLAYNLYGNQDLVCPIMDARREQVYTGLYSFDAENEFELKEIMGQSAMSIQDLINKINEIGRRVVFLGDGVPVFADTIKELIKVSYSFAPAHMNRQSAGSVAALAVKYYEAGKIVDAKDHEPEYLRLSQAERERIEQNHAG